MRTKNEVLLLENVKGVEVQGLLDIFLQEYVYNEYHTSSKYITRVSNVDVNPTLYDR